MEKCTKAINKWHKSKKEAIACGCYVDKPKKTIPEIVTEIVKPKTEIEQHDDDETDSREHIPVTSPQGLGVPGVESEFEDEKPDEGINPVVVFVIIFIAVIFAVLIFFKDTVADFWKGEKHE